MADRIFKFNGFTSRAGQEQKMKGIFAAVEDDKIEGKGLEDNTPFDWEGKIEEGNKISLVKNFLNGTTINFEGDIEAFAIKGRYNIEDELGEFEFKYEESIDEEND